MYICIYMYMYVCVCVHTHTHTHMRSYSSHVAMQLEALPTQANTLGAHLTLSQPRLPQATPIQP